MPDIRALTLDDADALHPLRCALFPEEPPERLFEELPELLNGEGNAAFGAFLDGALAGYVEVSERPWGEGCETEPVGWVEGIYVEAEHRRRGIGRALIDRAAAWTRGRGLAELGSDAYIDNHVSLMAHARWGFAETKRVVMMRRKL